MYVRSLRSLRCIVYRYKYSTFLMYNEIIVIYVLYNDKQPNFTGGAQLFTGGGGPPAPPPAGYAPVVNYFIYNSTY